MNEKELREAVRAEFGGAQSSQLVDRRMREAYQMLEEQESAESFGRKGRSQKKRPLMRIVKILGSTAGGLAAAFLILLGISMVNPALAAELPLIGGIFQRIQSYGPSNLAETQGRIQEYAEPVPSGTAASENAVTSIEVPAANQDEKPMRVAVREAYFDGVFVYASLDMEIDSDAELLYDAVVPDGYGVLINGEEQIGWNEKGGRGRDAQGFAMLDRYQWQKDGEGRYITQQAFLVPEKFQGLDSLEITLNHHAVSAVYQNVWDQEYGEYGVKEEVLNTSGYSLRFTVEKNQAKQKRIEGDGMEMGGVKLISAVSSPAGIAITVEIPDSYNNPACGAQLEDGTALGGLSRTEVEQEGGVRLTQVFGSLQEGETRRVLYSVFDKNNTQEYVAVFYLDFEAGTAVLDTPEVAEKIPSSLCYVCGAEKLEGLEGCQMSYFNYSCGAESAKMIIAASEDYRELRVEVWQGERKAASTVSVESSEGALGFSKNYRYRDTSGDHETGLNCYTLAFQSISLDHSQDVTVKAFDNASQELLYQETVSLTADPVM